MRSEKRRIRRAKRIKGPDEGEEGRGERREGAVRKRERKEEGPKDGEKERREKPGMVEQPGPHRHVFCVVLNYVASSAPVMKRYRLIIQRGS